MSVLKSCSRGGFPLILPHVTIHRPIALVRRPGPRLAEGLVTHIQRSAIDVELAVRQWQNYIEILRQCDWRVVEVPASDDCPDSVFVEDTVVMFKQTAIIARPGSDSRKPETAAVEQTVEGLGCIIQRIEAPGTMDGGDVLKIGDTIYVGQGGRTNPVGIQQFAAIVEPLGARVVAVPLTKALHLKSAVTALPDGLVVGWSPVLDSPAVFPRFLPMPEESGAHVVILGDKTLMMASDAPESAEIFRRMGYSVIEVDIGEFIKLEGCVTCLSVRIRCSP